MKRAIISIIILYKRAISPFIGRSCRFYPGCSDYFNDAVLKYGALRGSIMGIWRIMRCNQLSKGGYDPVR